MSIRLTPVVLAVAALCTLGCEHPPLFPPTVLESTHTAFDFSAWRMTPNVQIGHKIQMGGRIVDMQEKDGMLRPSITQLPIVAHPAYGPTDTGRPTGGSSHSCVAPFPSDSCRRAIVSWSSG